MHSALALSLRALDRGKFYCNVKTRMSELGKGLTTRETVLLLFSYLVLSSTQRGVWGFFFPLSFLR